MFFLRLKYLLKGINNIKYDSCSTMDFAHVKMKKSRINASNNSHIKIGKNCVIQASDINIQNGSLIIGENVSLINTKIKINQGTIIIKNNARIMCHIWIRYGGVVNIGEYTNINIGSEIRSDESITIGDFTQISYNVNIWDTNTHCIYPPYKRRELSKTIGIGNEIEKPITKPVKIGNDCWIAKNSSILKGVVLGDNTIVGYGTTIINKCIENNSIIVPKLDFKNKPINNI